VAIVDVRSQDSQTRADGRAKTALLCSVLAFLAGQAVLAYIVSQTHPELRDPEYGYRLLQLRRLTAGAPQRPLCLILGSSRTLSGIYPPALPPWPADAGPEPRVFNFSQFCAGPVRELQTLRRLLAAGHRPDWLLLEVWPPYWPQRGYWVDELHMMQTDFRPVDLPVVLRYFTDHRQSALTKLAAETLLPITGLRSNLLALCACSLLSPDQRGREKQFASWRDIDPSGWRPWLERGTEEEFRVRIAHLQGEKQYLEHFVISDTTDRSLREILEECRRHHIKTALILMPEHSQLRNWYTLAVHEQVNSYLDRLRCEYQIHVFDTRTWMSDDQFYDLTHMIPSAAVPFTQRLGRELLLPWLTGYMAHTNVRRQTYQSLRVSGSRASPRFGLANSD